MPRSTYSPPAVLLVQEIEMANVGGLPPIEQLPRFDSSFLNKFSKQETHLTNVDHSPSLPPLEQMPTIDLSFLNQFSNQKKTDMTNVDLRITEN